MIVLAVNWIMAVRVPLGLLLVLILPGFALTLALFPRPSLGALDRAALTLGLSLAVGALSGFLLNGIPGGITARSWALLLTGVIAIAGAVAIMRRGKNAAVPVSWGARAIPLRQGLLFGVAAVIAITAITISYTGERHRPTPGFSQLWLLPAAGESPTVHIGIASHEPATTQYRLQLGIDGQVVQEWPSLTLRPNGQWETMAVLPGSATDSGRVEAVLYRANQPSVVYRRAVLAP